jgi:putative DNA primase/helicase
VSESGFPGYAVSAPTQGTGKTTLLELIWRAVFGRPIPVQAWPGVEEEVAKVILAILLEGHPGILWDNLPDNRPFDSATIAKTMTSEMLSGRVLGETRTATALSGAVQLFTGNNVTPAGDLATRILPIVLDARLERPDARQFTRPAWADWVDIHRAEVLHHLLTILVGGITARTSVPTPSRFPAWDRLVRGPLLWAGGLDPAELFERNLQADPIRNNHQELVAALYGVYGEGTFLARHVTCDHTDPHHLYDNKGRRVWDVLRDIAGGRPISNRSLGIHLARAAGKQLGRYRLVRSRVDRDGAQWWRIECSSSVEFPMREWRRVNQSLLHKFPEIQKLYAPCPPPLPHSHLVPLTSSEAA